LGVYGPEPSFGSVEEPMDNPRPTKVAVVDEVRDRLAASDGAVLTEYRGLTVGELAALRRELTAAGSDYKIYKNTLVRLAVADSPQSALTDLLVGPTAIAFVQGDVSAVAKALRNFSRDNPSLVIKGGMVGDGVLSAADIGALAALPSRDVLLAQFAGALSAPLQQLAGLLQALPRNLAYGLAALVDQRREAGETGDAGQAESAAESGTTEVVADETGAAPEAAAAEVSDEPAATAAAAAAEPETEAGAGGPSDTGESTDTETASAEPAASEPEGSEPAAPEGGE
jgi:large subunit ribosomal protein L10